MALKLKTCKYADVSTCHISEQDASCLEEDARYHDERLPMGPRDREPRVIVCAYDTGFFVHTGTAEDKEALDAAGDVYEEIEEFDW